MANKPKGRGRPRLGSESTKSEAVLLRLEPGEKEGFRAAAHHAGLDLSSWMRLCLRREARKELEEARLPIPFIKPLELG